MQRSGSLFPLTLLPSITPDAGHLAQNVRPSDDSRLPDNAGSVSASRSDESTTRKTGSQMGWHARAEEYRELGAKSRVQIADRHSPRARVSAPFGALTCTYRCPWPRRPRPDLRVSYHRSAVTLPIGAVLDDESPPDLGPPSARPPPTDAIQAKGSRTPSRPQFFVVVGLYRCR